MSSRKTKLDTSLFRPREEIEQDLQPVVDSSGDMTPDVRKRASFDIRPDQIQALGTLKYKTGKKISDLVVEALDDLIQKYER